MRNLFKREKLTEDEKARLRQIEHEAFFAQKKSQAESRMNELVRQAQERGKRKATPFSKRTFNSIVNAGKELNKFAQNIDYDGIFESYTGKEKKKGTKKK